MIIIKKPMYMGDVQKRCIGLPDFRLRNEGEIVEIKIMHKRTDGTEIYPDTYEMAKSEIAKYPHKELYSASGVCVVFIVPIADLKIKQGVK